MTKAEIQAATKTYGGNWGYQHVQRLLTLIENIGEDRTYQHEVIWYATYLHDWGAYSKYKVEGLDHALRSKQVATEILPQTDLSPELIPLTLDVIEYHDYRDERDVHAIEAVLLRDADFLDFIGAVGIARAFASNPKDLKNGLEMLVSRKEGVAQKFTLQKAREMAISRLQYVDDFIRQFYNESFGCY